jgi:hypothetical protein
MILSSVDVFSSMFMATGSFLHNIYIFSIPCNFASQQNFDIAHVRHSNLSHGKLQACIVKSVGILLKFLYHVSDIDVCTFST